MADHDNKLELELKPMDPELAKAARTGDLNFLRKAVADCKANNNDYSYFFSTFTSDSSFEVEGNIFHLAAWEGRVEFFKEAMESLSRKQSVVQVLLSHQPEWLGLSGVNPLHVAAFTGAVEILELIREFYTSLAADPSAKQIGNNNRQPWLAQDVDGQTPLHVALGNKKKECAKVLMYMDVKLVTNMTNKYGNSPLFLAVKKGCQQVAWEILTSAHPYSLSGRDHQTPLHFVPNCSEEVCRLLLEKHPQLLKAVDRQRRTVMHSWISQSDDGAMVWPFEYLLLDDCSNISPELRMDFLKLLIETDKCGENPLHYAAKRKGTASIARILVKAYQKERTAKKTTLSYLFENPVPWLRENRKRKTPLDIALDGDNEEVALCFLSPEINTILDRQDYMNNYLLLAIEKNRYKFAQGILVEASKKGDSRTILSIIHHCWNFRDVCIKVKDTPLHHLRRESGYQAYQEFLKIPMMSQLKNFQDSNGATPLHQAIRNRNIHLTEALLTMEDVDRSIKDKKGNSPMDLLADVCLEEPGWDEMCQRIGIIPETTYFQDKNNLLEVRNTLSVVAALLATITFTAGFTLPGGFNSNSGKAILGEKAAFIVFLLADVLAMCCSMLVLVSLIWSMVCHKYKSLVLIDRSMPLLMLALYSTILAFMTGIYIVIPHKSLWAVIIVLVMCSLITISSKRSFMFKMLKKLNPGIGRAQRDRFRLMEQGTTSAVRSEESLALISS